MTAPGQTNPSVTVEEILAELRTLFTPGAAPASIHSKLKGKFKPRKISLDQIINAIDRLEKERNAVANVIRDFKSHIESLKNKDGPQMF